jgi:hypothetical protein
MQKERVQKAKANAACAAQNVRKYVYVAAGECYTLKKRRHKICRTEYARFYQITSRMRIEKAPGQQPDSADAHP